MKYENEFSAYATDVRNLYKRCNEKVDKLIEENLKLRSELSINEENLKYGQDLKNAMLNELNLLSKEVQNLRIENKELKLKNTNLNSKVTKLENDLKQAKEERIVIPRPDRPIIPPVVNVDYSKYVKDIEVTELENENKQLKKKIAILIGEKAELNNELNNDKYKIKNLISELDAATRKKPMTISKSEFLKQCYENLSTDYNKLLEKSKGLENFANDMISGFTNLKTEVNNLIIELEKETRSKI